VDRVAELEHVAAVERARLLDALDRVAELGDARLDADGLGAPRRDTGPRYHGDVLVDDCVLDEDAVRRLVGRRRLDRLPARILERLHVRRPLRAGQVDVDRLPFEVCDDALTEPRAGPADERPHDFT
jgi:hypothetical protein